MPTTRSATLARIPLLFCIIFFTLIVYLRFLQGGSDPSHFILLTEKNVERSEMNEAVYLVNSGYDGQFYYRYALHPFSPDVEYGRRLGNHGIKIDNPRYRRTRLLYPLLAWVVAAGQSPLVPYTLIVINILAFMLLAWLGQRIIAHYRAEPLWLYFLLFIGGFYFSAARNLPDLLTCTLLAGTYLSFIQRRLGWFVASSTLVLLCRESSAFYLLPAYGLWFFRDWKAHPLPQLLTKKAVLLLPWIVWLGWKIVLGEMYPNDEFTTLDGFRKHFTFPFGGMLASLQHSFTDPSVPLFWSLTKIAYMLWTLSLLVICLHGIYLRRQSATTSSNLRSLPPEQSWAFWSLGIGIILTLTYALPIYTDPWSFMRVLAPTHLFCWFFLLAFRVELPAWMVVYSGGVAITVIGLTVMVN